VNGRIVGQWRGTPQKLHSALSRPNTPRFDRAVLSLGSASVGNTPRMLGTPRCEGTPAGTPRTDQRRVQLKTLFDLLATHENASKPTVCTDQIARIDTIMSDCGGLSQAAEMLERLRAWNHEEALDQTEFVSFFNRILPDDPQLLDKMVEKLGQHSTTAVEMNTSTVGSLSSLPTVKDQVEQMSTESSPSLTPGATPESPSVPAKPSGIPRLNLAKLAQDDPLQQQKGTADDGFKDSIRDKVMQRHRRPSTGSARSTTSSPNTPPLRYLTPPTTPEMRTPLKARSPRDVPLIPEVDPSLDAIKEAARKKQQEKFKSR